jgi:hypothetical protein
MRSARPSTIAVLPTPGSPISTGLFLVRRGEHLDGAANLLVAADHRVELALAGLGGEVAGILLQRVVLVLGRGGIGRPALPDLLDRGIQRLRGDASLLEDFRRLGVLLHGQRQQQPLDGDEGVTRLLGDLVRRVEDLGGRLGEIDLPVAAGNLGDRVERLLGGGERRLRVAAGPGDQPGREALGIVEQDLEDVLRGELLVPLAQGPGLGGLDETARPVGIVLEIHMPS